MVVKRRLGDDYFDDDGNCVGHFWSLLETRPGRTCGCPGDFSKPSCLTFSMAVRESWARLGSFGPKLELVKGWRSGEW